MGKNKNKLPTMLSKEQLVQLFESVYMPKLSIACFVALMCGLRIREVCRIEIQDIDLQNRRIKIKDSKNPNRKKQNNYGKDRYVPIPEIAISPIKKWLSIIEGGKYLLPSEKSPDTHLRTKTLHEWFREARKRANLNEIDYKAERKNQPDMTVFKFRFHHLRHYYAQYIYDRTRDLYAVKELLGHERIDTTTVYAKVSNVVKRDTVDFAFNSPIKTKIFEDNPVNALNYNIPTVAKEKSKDKSPVEIIEERFARGEISASDFQTALRLLKARKDFLNDNEKANEQYRQVEDN